MRLLKSYGQYTVAFGALDYLISRSNERALREFWPSIARTGNFTKAFTSAFGMSPQVFYGRFVAYRANGYR
jgi:hypothetical protein